MSQNVTQHKARNTDSPMRNGQYQVELTTKLTHRKIGKILLLVQNQLCEFLKGKWSVADLSAAFNDTKVKEVVQKHFRDDNIKLVHQKTGEPLADDEGLGQEQHAAVVSSFQIA